MLILYNWKTDNRDLDVTLILVYKASSDKPYLNLLIYCSINWAIRTNSFQMNIDDCLLFIG